MNLHHALIDPLIRTGSAPSSAELGAAFGRDAVDRGLRDLEAAHGVVLHPGTLEPWVVHPFSLSPTATWVQGRAFGWWAPCTWCALGICALVGGRCTIHARLGGEAEDVDLDVVDGHVEHADLQVHFPIPPARAWDNVHHHCAMVLPFRDAASIDGWSRRHGLPRGEAVPVDQVAALARAWYGRHADPDWRKWTVAEAAAIFASVGLTGPFWELSSNAGRF